MADGVRVIVTDIGSVLFRFDPERRFRLLTERTGIERDELHRLLFASGFESRCEAGEFTPEQIRDHVAEATGFDGGVDELSRLWTSAFDVDGEVLATLTALDQPLAIFSNNGPMFADFLDRRFSEVGRWFRHRYFACRLKARKPDPAAFAAVEQGLAAGLAVEPDQLFFIDDSSENTSAAIERGWRAHTFAGIEGLREAIGATV